MKEPPLRRAGVSAARWQQIRDLLASAIECSADDRDRLLQACCANDEALRREVEALLVAHEETGLLDTLAGAIAPAAAWARAQAAGWEGRRIDRYVVLDLLGAGGMGLVYRARDERLGRRIALKFLPAHLCLQAAAKERFLAEARAAAALDHPNVCAIHEIGETEDGQLFIAMPLYEGETLRARIKRGRLVFGEAMPIAIQIARGLGHAHDRGIVHRDVKPSNVMVLADGTVRILDFGIAKVDDPSAIDPLGPLGTIAYMSPEHLSGGSVDHRTDVWSLGVLLHEMITGTRPFHGDSRQELADAILNRDPDLLATSHPEVPTGIDDVLRRALNRRPEDRYPSMATFSSALATLSADAEGAPRGPLNEQNDDAIPTRNSGSPSPGERRRAVVLVTTVSDYAALIEHMTPADAQQVVSQIGDLAVDVVRRHGGLVNQAISEEIVSLFGVPTAHDDDELRAVRAALELHARVREMGGTGSSRRVRVQSGIHGGPLVVQRLNDGPRRYAVVGPSVQVASRLAAGAGADDVVLSPECQRLVSPFVRTSPGRPVVLDPDAGPMTPFCVTGETGLETRLEASEQAGLSPYVGRQPELAWLEAQVAQARAGHGSMIAIVGEAGAGKSRLLHELRVRLVGAEDVRLLRGRCRAYGDATPYFPFVDVLRGALDIPCTWRADARDVVARLRALDASLEPFIPLYLHLLSISSESHAVPRHLQGEHLHAALLDALAKVMAVLASRATLVVVLEDWHWADAASQAALDRMGDVIADTTMFIVVTARPDRASVDRPTKAIRIRLEPLDFAATVAIMQAVLRVDRVSTELARRVFDRTGGNPFFVEQVCHALVEHGAVSLRSGETIVEGGADALSLPDTVQAVIRSRLDRLDPDAREVLRVAAVIGREFEHALLAETLEAHVDVGRALDRLQNSGLIQRIDGVPEVAYRFRHVLTLEVSYDGLLAHQRRSLHGSIGRAIEAHHARRTDEKAALLAHHFERGEVWSDAVAYGRRAAERASALSQFGDALATLDRVVQWIDYLPDNEANRDLKADILLQQERVCETLGLRGRQQEIVRHLIAHLVPRGLSPRLAEAYLRQGDLLTLLQRFRGADRALGTALRIGREQGNPTLERNALRSLGLLRWHEGRHEEALATIEQALVIDRACQDEGAIALDVTNLANVLRSMGEHTRALARLEEVVAMPAVADDPKKLAYLLHGIASVHRSLGELDRALSYLRRADEISRELALPVPRSFHLTSIAHINLQQGRIDAALDTYRRAVELSRVARDAVGLAQSLRMLGEVLGGLGRADEALPSLREAAQLFAQLEDRAAEADMWSQAAAAAEPASPLQAVDAWRRASSLRRRLGDTQGELEALEGLARSIRSADGTPEESIAAYEAALALAATLGDGSRELALRNSLGILEWKRGRFDAALRHYEAALILVRARGDRVHEGLILNSLGVTLTKLNRADEARTALEESVVLNRDTGQRMLEAHALAALGAVSRTIGRHDLAAQYIQESLSLRHALGDRVGEGWMHLRLAETLFAIGDVRGGRAAAARASTLAAPLDASLAHACVRLTSASDHVPAQE